MTCAAGLAVGRAIVELGAGDCEDLGTGALVQPVNAITSFAYVAVGVAVLVAAWRGGRRPSVDAWVYSGLLIAVGLGSVAFHGPQPTGARVMHDLPIFPLVFYMVARNLELVTAGRWRRWAIWLPVVMVGTVLTLIDIELGSPLVGVSAGAVAVSEAVIARRRLRAAGGAERRGGIVVAVVAAVAAATWLLGRTDSPVCEPGAVLQFHGIWHVLSAVVFGLWWRLAAPVTTSAEPAVAAPR